MRRTVRKVTDVGDSAFIVHNTGKVVPPKDTPARLPARVEYPTAVKAGTRRRSEPRRCRSDASARVSANRVERDVELRFAGAGGEVAGERPQAGVAVTPDPTHTEAHRSRGCGDIEQRSKAIGREPLITERGRLAGAVDEAADREAPRIAPHRGQAARRAAGVRGVLQCPGGRERHRCHAAMGAWAPRRRSRRSGTRLPPWAGTYVTRMWRSPRFPTACRGSP